MANKQPTLCALDDQECEPEPQLNWRVRDLRGKRFGHLTVIRATAERKHTYVVWLCRCDCGGTVKANTQALVSGSRTGCGDGGHKNSGQFESADLTGRRYGRLLVLERTTERKRNAWIWKCVCDCGSEVYASARYLQHGTLNSCGCIPRGRRPRYKMAGFAIQWNDYQRAAKKRGLRWELSAAQCWKLLKGRCHYCGIEPQRRISTIRRREWTRSPVFVCNGIDRVDSALGYTPTNCVPCCTACNRAKSSMTLADFKEWARRVYRHLGLGEPTNGQQD